MIINQETYSLSTCRGGNDLESSGLSGVSISHVSQGSAMRVEDRREGIQESEVIDDVKETVSHSPQGRCTHELTETMIVCTRPV